ncbi:unnamed protein product [Linum tenue]|uniref:Probable magnesium transporter n=1 Tax=Linum tenue TaxID=586396 RepID=A0AAV0GV29_9ROSI|nr:unnamed protein product [Linum tenue]
MGVSENTTGLILAVASSAFIGSSFILKKKGLKRAGASGTRAGVGGYTYLLEPLWWVGMVTMILGEVANFVAYVYAPAVLVTPLGALSIIISAILAHFMLNERLPRMGVLGCVSCIVGSVIIVLHAPQEQPLNSVEEVWNLATQPGGHSITSHSLILLSTIIHYLKLLTSFCSFSDIYSRDGLNSVSFGYTLRTTIWSNKHVGLLRNMLLDGFNHGCEHQGYWNSYKAYTRWDKSDYLSSDLVVHHSSSNMCHYTVKLFEQGQFRALDTYNAAVVSPVYYVMFTTLTIVASAIMFKDWEGQDASSIASEICGFITVLTGTIILHSTRDQEPPPSSGRCLLQLLIR